MKKIIAPFLNLIFASKRSRFLMSVTILALLLRVAIIAVASDPQHPEMYEHGAIAHNLYTGHGFAMHWPYQSLDPNRVAMMKMPPEYEGAFLPPLNPYLIYGTYLIFGENSKAIIFLMFFYAIISSFIPFAVFKTGLLIGSEKAARSSSLIALFFLPAAFAVTTFSGSPLYQLLGIVILYYAIHVTQQPSLKSFIILGLCCGAMTFLRSEFFILGFILIATSVFFAKKRFQKEHVLRRGLISLILCAAIIAPWTYRNYTLFHSFIPVLSHPWYEMWRGNNRLATGTTLDENGQSIWVTPQKYPELIKRMDAIPYDQYFEARVDGIFKDEVIKFIEEKPGRFLFLGIKKIAFLFTIDFTHPASRNPLYFGPMILVSALTILGFFKLIRYGQPETVPAAAIFTVFLLCYFGLTVLTVMLPRYQIYMFTAGMGVAGLGLGKFSSLLKGRTGFADLSKGGLN